MTLLFQGGWCLCALRLRDKWRIRVAMREADKVGAGCDDDSCVKVTRENYRSMSAYCNVGYDECSSIKILSDDCGYANAREVCAQPMPCGNDRCEVLGLVPEVQQGDSAPCSNAHGPFADARGSFQLLKRGLQLGMSENMAVCAGLLAFHTQLMLSRHLSAHYVKQIE